MRAWSRWWLSAVDVCLTAVYIYNSIQCVANQSQRHSSILWKKLAAADIMCIIFIGYARNESGIYRVSMSEATSHNSCNVTARPLLKRNAPASDRFPLRCAKDRPLRNLLSEIVCLNGVVVFMGGNKQTSDSEALIARRRTLGYPTGPHKACLHIVRTFTCHISLLMPYACLKAFSSAVVVVVLLS